MAVISTATLAKVARQLAVKVATDDKLRKKTLYMVMGIVIAIIVMLALVIAVAISPTLSVVFPLNSYDIFPADVHYEQIGIYPMPCDTTTITSYFGSRNNPLHTDEIQHHTGIDFATTHYSEIVSIAEGTVVSAGYRQGYGRTVIVDHGGGMSTLYAHLSKIYAVRGQSVHAGSVLGLEGGDPELDTLVGNSTGHHLHFEVCIDGVAVDPYKYILEPPIEEEQKMFE